MLSTLILLGHSVQDAPYEANKLFIISHLTFLKISKNQNFEKKFISSKIKTAFFIFC